MKYRKWDGRQDGAYFAQFLDIVSTTKEFVWWLSHSINSMVQFQSINFDIVKIMSQAS